MGGAGAYPFNQSYYAPITNLGIGAWNLTTNYSTEFYGSGCTIYGDHIYCVGTLDNMSNSSSYFATVSSSGISNWSETTSYPTGMYFGSCSAYNGYIYCIGGGDYNASYRSYYAPISDTGIGQWKPTTNYPSGFYNAGCQIYNGYIYCVGNDYVSPGNLISINTTQYVYYAPVSTGGIGDWSLTSNSSAGKGMYPVPLAGEGCNIYNSTIYCVGNLYNFTNASTSSYYAHILGNGAVGTWIPTTSYPTALALSGCSVSNGYIFCVGTFYGNDTSASYYAPISSQGIGQWNETYSYPTPMYYASCSVPGESGGLYSG